MNQHPKQTDVLILGAGGAGLFCGAQAARRGRSVVILDHAKSLGAKILISGGGRCNFTNLGASPQNYVSQNPHFCKSALAQFTQQDFLSLVKKHGISFYEKKLGQLFCETSAREIVQLLEKECTSAGALIQLETKIESVTRLPDSQFSVQTSRGEYLAQSVVVATGGLSIPKIGATDLGYRIATHFGLKLVPTVPALDGFVFNAEDATRFAGLAGISIDCKITTGRQAFRENILFTHSGLSGPASLQASLHWYPDQPVTIDCSPDLALGEWLIEEKQKGATAHLKTLLSYKLPARFVETFLSVLQAPEGSVAQMKNETLQSVAKALHAWTFTPKTTVGYSKAEVTRGGVDTQELSSKTMESIKVPGLYFIGEVVDVTGWLGGYNFQWAWSSGWVAGQNA